MYIYRFLKICGFPVGKITKHLQQIPEKGTSNSHDPDCAKHPPDQNESMNQTLIQNWHLSSNK